MNNYSSRVQKINCLSNDLDRLYHKAARKLGVSDSIMCVMYIIYMHGDGCLLHNICEESGISKQTINSAIRQLEKKQILYLIHDKGNTKRVYMTDEGKSFLLKTAGVLFKTECNAFADWTEEETKVYFKLMKKYINSFQKQIEKM